VTKFHIVVITVVLTLAVVAAIGIPVALKVRASRQTVVVRVEKAQRGELIEFVSAPGQIEPKTKVEISAKLTARIVELPYKKGDRVQKSDLSGKVLTAEHAENAETGKLNNILSANSAVSAVKRGGGASVLVRLDAKDLESELRSAEAIRAAQAAQSEVEKARIASQQASLAGLAAEVAQAEQDLQRQQALLQSQDISQASYDQAKLKLDGLKSQHDAAEHTLRASKLNLVVLQHNLEAADARIAQAQEALTYTTITSPIDGVVTRINAEVGELVVTGTMNNPGTVIMEVADLSQMLVVAQVDEADVGKLKVGQKATIHVDAFADREFAGVVDSIALAHDVTYTMTKYFRTEILLDDTEEKLHSGLTAHVDIETRKHTDVLKLPTQAVLGREVDGLPLGIREKSAEVDTSKTYATVVYRYVDGKAVVTPVKIGQSDLTHTIILSGISEQDKIIVGPYKVLEKVQHGQRIRDERE
jgi:HlyD family secretion protein